MLTARINIENRNGENVLVRAIIDTASTSNFICMEIVKKLNLKIHPEFAPIQALENLSTKSKGYVNATIKSRFGNFRKNLEFQVVSEIAHRLPNETLDRRSLAIPKNLALADPDFHRPAPIDLLLDVETALNILCVGQKSIINSELRLQKTLLGWVIGGRASIPHHSLSTNCMFIKESELDLTRFWDVEEGKREKYYTNEERACEVHFIENYERNKEGQYILALPFNEKVLSLGDSKTLAIKRLEGLRRKLDRDRLLKEEYYKVLNEYINLGHMTPIPREKESLQGYYLPHHAVIKKDSLTTKVRVVFDGSAKTTTGVSLNDTLMTGPTIQSDLFSILVRFRVHAIVLTADIEKMYRQFWIRKEDRKYQKILWENEHGETQTYELNTVTFGLSSAPYLAIRALHQLADDEATDFPKASQILKQDLYVDDALTGAESREEAIAIRDELTLLLKRGGLNIRQWASNDPALFKDLPPKSVNLQLQMEETATIKTLGLHWDPQRDKIVYTVKLNPQKHRVTKRNILSETARIFDPLGLLAPVIITAKIMMQKLWALKLDWDESLPEILHSEWLDYYQGLSHLNNIAFNRRTFISKAEKVEIHGFCDASEKAYGACLYARCTNSNGEVSIELLTAKTRVSPLKTISVPRLELCGAFLLMNMYTTIKNALNRIDKKYFWTDSMIVLHWIRTSPQRLKTFVANRVAEIQKKTDPIDWRHVRSQDNPADLLSRGLTPHEFIKSKLWCKGPSWLSNEKSWPRNSLDPLANLPEIRSEICFLSSITSEKNDRCSILKRFSSIEKLKRVIAYCLRWLKTHQSQGQLTIKELRRAHKAIIYMTQENEFPEIFTNLRKNKSVEGNKKLSRLNPFLDNDGLLRVGGRLRNAEMPFSERYPLILPKDHHITTIIIRREHEINLHAGTQATLYALRRQYWPIDGRSQVWKIIKNCIVCWKTRPTIPNYIMADLPTPRVTMSRPFTHVGVDYCGPFLIKEKKYRNTKRIKVYVAIFVCLSVKAIHCELVSDLTTDGFIAELRRFISRRGLCAHIYSDNGKNFVGANNYIRDLITVLKSEDCQKGIQTFLRSKSIEWHFSPPRSPHFGGLWEAAVKGFKRHLLKIAGNELSITFEEFNTLIIEIEAVLNSRPLTPLSNDPNDLSVLTPGHFLIGEPLTSLRDHDYDSIPTNRLSVWQHLSKLREDFWTRWKREYLNEISCRQKWTEGSHNIDVNTMVLLKDDNLPSSKWPLGRVTEIYPGVDKIVRTVAVRTANGIVKRGIKAIVPLPLEKGAH